MQKIIATFIAACFFGCSAAGDGQLGQLDSKLIGSVQGDTNPLTFWHYGTDYDLTVPALECAIERINRATCLGLDVSINAHHWVRLVAPETIPGYAGRATGSWDSMRIRISIGTYTEERLCDLMVHEIAEHLLPRSNGHAGSPTNVVLNEATVTRVCERQDCACFQPE